MFSPLSTGPTFAVALAAAKQAKMRGSTSAIIPSPEVREKRLRELADHLYNLPGCYEGIEATAETPADILRAMRFGDNTLLHQIYLFLMEKAQVRVRPMLGDIMDALALDQVEMLQVLFDHDQPSFPYWAGEAIVDILGPKYHTQYTFGGPVVQAHTSSTGALEINDNLATDPKNAKLFDEDFDPHRPRGR